MIILVISIIIILVAGFFALIRPTYNKLVTDQNTYESTKTEWDGIKQKLDAIPALKEGITEVYNSAKKDAGIFVNEAFGDVNDTLYTDHVNYAMDQYIQPALDESNLTVSSMVLGGAAGTSIGYYCYAPNVVTYALLEAADVNGNYAETATKALEMNALIAQRETAELLGESISLEVSGTRENLMTFLEAIKSDENAVLINSVDIADYTFSGGLEEGQVVDVVSVDEDGNETVTQQVVGAGAEPGTGTSNYSILITFYNAKEIDTPDLGD